MGPCIDLDFIHITHVCRSYTVLSHICGFEPFWALLAICDHWFSPLEISFLNILSFILLLSDQLSGLFNTPLKHFSSQFLLLSLSLSLNISTNIYFFLSKVFLISHIFTIMLMVFYHHQLYRKC